MKMTMDYEHTEPDGTPCRIDLQFIRPVFGLWSGQLRILDAEARSIVERPADDDHALSDRFPTHVWYDRTSRRLILEGTRRFRGTVLEAPREARWRVAISKDGTYRRFPQGDVEGAGALWALVYDFSVGRAGRLTSWEPRSGFPVISQIKRRGTVEKPVKWAVRLGDDLVGEFTTLKHAADEVSRRVSTWRRARQGNRVVRLNSANTRRLSYILKRRGVEQHTLRVVPVE